MQLLAGVGGALVYWVATAAVIGRGVELFNVQYIPHAIPDWARFLP